MTSWPVLPFQNCSMKINPRTHMHGCTHSDGVHAQSSWLNDSLSQPLNPLVLEADWQACAVLVNNYELQVLEGGLKSCYSVLLLYLGLPVPGLANGGAVWGRRTEEGREERQTKADCGTPRCQRVNRGSPVEPCSSPTAQTMQTHHRWTLCPIGET